MAGDPNANVTSDAHNALARQLSAEATVLVQNTRSTLPLPHSPALRIAVIGDACYDTPIVAGMGSGAVAPPYIVTVLRGVQAAVEGFGGNGSTITYSRTSPVSAAVAAAQAADVAIMCTATVSSEGIDRLDLSLPAAEDAVIEVRVRPSPADPQSTVRCVSIAPLE